MKLRTTVLFGILACVSVLWAQQNILTKMEILPTPPAQPSAPVTKSDEEWKKSLTTEQYYVLREHGTERPFGSINKQVKEHGDGTYYCAGCNAELFSSKTKFDSGSGWPSFYDVANAKNVKLLTDGSAGMERTEVRCAVCDSHLGHVFTGESYGNPIDKRYCINGVCLKFAPAGGVAEKK